MVRLNVMTVGEFETYLDELRSKVKEWKSQKYGYTTIRCMLTEEVSNSAGTADELMFTATQLKEIFELAK